MRKLLEIKILCGVILCFLLQANVNAQSGKTWKIGHPRPAGSAIDVDIQKFTKNIDEYTQGKIHFEVYEANKLGDYSVVQERVSLGEVEMYLGPFGTAVDKRLTLAFVPFLVEDWEKAEQVYSSGSPLLKHMELFLRQQNIKILGGYPVYFGGLALTEKPLAPGDPEVNKKMIIRIPPIRSFELTARELGYTPYPITWMYARMGLKTGMVDGIIGGGAEGYHGLPAIRYYLPVKDHFEYWFIYMNLDLWEELTPQNQQAISRAAEEMETERYRYAEDNEKKSIVELRRSGIEILEIKEKELDAMRRKIKHEVWPILEKDIGSAFDEVVRFLESSE